MKRASFLALFLAAIGLLTTGCGTSDSVKSLTLTSNGVAAGGFFNLVGVDGTLQLVVVANYNSGKTVDVTNSSTFAMTPELVDDTGLAIPAAGPNTVTISPTGMMTAINPICTWTDAINTTLTPPAPYSPPVWQYTGWYQVVASYKGFTSQPIAVGVGAAASNAPTGGCGPS